jgi:hypothetical protein
LEYHFYSIIDQFDIKAQTTIKEKIVSAPSEENEFELSLKDIFRKGIIVLCDCYE